MKVVVDVWKEWYENVVVKVVDVFRILKEESEIKVMDVDEIEEVNVGVEEEEVL